MKLLRSLAALLCLMPAVAWAQGAKAPPGITPNSDAALRSLAISQTNTLGRGINLTQSLTGLPASGAPDYPNVWSNKISIQSDNAQAGGGFGAGLTVFHNFGGSQMTGGRNSFGVYSLLTSPSNASNPNRNYFAGFFGGYAYSSDGGTDLGAGAKGAIFGINPVGTLRSGATNMLEVTGGEVNVVAETGSSVRHKFGLTIVGGNASNQVQGTDSDAALGIGLQGSGVTFRDGILFSAANGQFPLSSTNSTVIRTSGGSFYNGIDFSGSSATNAYFLAPGFGIYPNSLVQGGAYVLGGDANGRLRLGTIGGTTTPYLDFGGNGVASTYSSRILSNAAYSLNIQSPNKTQITINDTNLKMGVPLAMNTQPITGLTTQSFSGSGSFDGSGTDLLRINGGGSAGGMIIYGNIGTGNDGTIRFRNNSADNTAGASITAGSGSSQWNGLMTLNAGLNLPQTNAGIDIGNQATSNQPGINLHSGGSSTIDARIYATGGTAGTAYKGNLYLAATTVQATAATPSTSPATGAMVSSGGLGVVGALNVGGITAFGSVARLQPYTVATLPACNAATQDGLATVTDATSPTYGGALTGGGTVRTPVYCNGTAWSSH